MVGAIKYCIIDLKPRNIILSAEKSVCFMASNQSSIRALNSHLEGLGEKLNQQIHFPKGVTQS
jgi:bisphosphoglycerate-dependent phosphoglycerate mutase